MSNTNINLPTQTSSVLQNDTVSSCSTSEVQKKTQLSRSRCMNSLREVKSQFKFLTETLQDFVLSKEDLKGTRIEHGFKRAFMSLFGQDVDTFTSTMLLNIDQLQKQLDKDEFQEDGSMAAFWVTQKSKHDTGKAVDDDLVVIESRGTESEVQDDNSRSGNDTDADDGDIRPIYDEETTTEVGLTRQHGQSLNETSNKAKIKKEIDVLETMNIELEHSVAKLRKENETLKKHYKDLYDSIKITRSKTIEQTTSLLANNVDLKAQIQEKVFAIAALKNDLRKLKGNSVNTNFKFIRLLPKKTEFAFAKPDHMIASSSSRNSSKNMPRFSSNDMVHNHYLDVAKKKIQERDRNSTTSVTTSARIQTTADDSIPKLGATIKL
ncbi:hypothetical protein Tco_1327286 [Tanacetum coccineum]